MDNSGTVVEHIRYDAFGQVTSVTDAQTGATLAEASTRYPYTGREWEADLALYYYRARWYDPTTGRFVSQDPIGFQAGDANLYRYVGNSVLNANDPSGLEDKKKGDYAWYPLGPGAMPPPGWNPSDKTREDSARQARKYYSIDTLVVALGVICEPFDWVVTAVDIFNHPTDSFSYAGLLQFLPSGSRRLVQKAKASRKMVRELRDTLGTGFLARSVTMRIALVLSQRPFLTHSRTQQASPVALTIGDVLS